MAFHKVLIALDDGPVAAHAVDVGIELSRVLRADVALIHVLEPPVSYDADIGVPPAELAEIAKQEGRRLLDGVRSRLLLEPSTLSFLESGSPPDQIVQAATAWPADLIVIGSHGRSGMQRVFLGSVAEAVLRHAQCPVLVVRVPK